MKVTKITNVNLSFSQTEDLKKHIHTVHEGHKNHKCETCGKSFSALSSLKNHIRVIHEGLKNYKCNTCGKFLAFKNLNDFLGHKKSIHNWCKYCDEYFGDSAEVNEHIKEIHGISTEQIKSQDIKLIFKNDE